MSRPPEFDADSCVRVELRGASCAACALACPVAAIEPTLFSVEIDAEACDGCLQCQGVCPGGAFGRVAAPEPHEGAVLLACRQARGAPSGPPCLHALGLDALADLYLRGARRVVAAIGDCAACVDGEGTRIEAPLAQLNTLLRARDLPQMTLEMIAESPGQTDAPDPARRGFLRAVSAAATTTKGPALERLQSIRADAPGMCFAFSPRIDPARCTGCDACAQLCPTGALTLLRDAGGALAYHAAPESCTNCLLCQDGCDSEAVVIDQNAPEAAPVPLTASRCRICGVEAHEPTLGRGATDVCRICRAKSQAAPMRLTLE